ncbi:Crp/Fnr family transcriptional regulator [uncultured Microscilla sp.]|uniref:Crp/Fnr family transcriptional regulator n=1 Tax=uncultured Microscilla sp. TaxID=432653 RepID=UPI0026085696|nr:Crp/Fnr family transcriptional regulator [uncultured Microscilla sp.]
MQQDVKYWYLRNHQIFSQITDDKYQELCVWVGFKKAIKNEDIFFTHEPVKRIYFLKKGMLKIISQDIDGNEVTKDIIQKGDIFGEIALDEAPDGETSEYAKVITDEAVMCTFTLENFEKVLAKNPSISLKFTKKVGNKLKTLENRYNHLIFKDVRTRVIHFLKKFVQDNGEAQGKLWLARNYLTHQDIAHLTGSTRQTVTSILNQLKKENQLIYSRNEIVILDLDGLR